ncbi:hypothetical protein HW445_32190, partial [Streptomyces sp. UH6]|nr:hypothetical protein [Streptomyces sp. UH6]
MAQEMYEAKAVVSNGVAYAGIKNVTGGVGRDFTWYDLTQTPGGGYPEGACGVSVSEVAHVVRIEVLTTDGGVYETSCDKIIGGDGSDQLDCDGVWEPQTIPSPGDPALAAAAEPLGNNQR